MKPLVIASACGLALVAAAACAPRNPPPARLALDCPATEGDLTRDTIAPDRKSCTYSNRDGDMVQLRLVSVSGTYEGALQPIEQELQTELMSDKEAAEGKVREADASAKAEAQTGSPEARSAANAAKQAANDALGEVHAAEDAAKDAEDVGAATHIDLPGIHINADEGGRADVNVGPIHVNAQENGATVRFAREVRLRGEALSPEKRGFRATYILANDNLKDGWRAVGYEAGGPKVGPITVAIVKTKSDDRDGLLGDIKRLVRLNGGV